MALNSSSTDMADIKIPASHEWPASYTEMRQLKAVTQLEHTLERKMTGIHVTSPPPPLKKIYILSRHLLYLFPYIGYRAPVFHDINNPPSAAIRESLQVTIAIHSHAIKGFRT